MISDLNMEHKVNKYVVQKWLLQWDNFLTELRNRVWNRKIQGGIQISPNHSQKVTKISGFCVVGELVWL